MALPENATVEVAANFYAGLDAANQFFIGQDPDSAPRRYADLSAGLREMIELLAWSPASGRPARFFSTKSAQARMRVETVMALARQAGLPGLREYPVGRHIVLYAHSDTRVVLLAMKHQRQLAYAVADDAVNGPR
uniref:hypothetical protein n=1 Tax=Castellaniella defragrans TaxID=75697 RepID=UPI00333F4E2E